MDVLLLGTGGPAGRPQRYCGCARCAEALATGEVRAPTSVLVDGTLLIDPGADPAHAAASCGQGLGELAHILLTGPAPAGMPEWAAAPGFPVESMMAPVTPPRHGGDGWQDRWLAVRAGDRVGFGAYDIRVLACTGARGAGPAVGYDITGPAGRLLYTPPRHVLAPAALESLAGAAFDVALLDLAAAASQLGELRRAQAVTGTTDVVAVHLTHDDPPEAELAAIVGAWGVRPGRDGLRAGAAPSAPRAGLPRRTLVLGGSRSGKSAEAERRMLGEPEVTYVATGPRAPEDTEWTARIAEHRARRPQSWRTLETTDLATAIRGARGPLLIDSLSLWLTAVMDHAAAWDDEAWASGAAAKTITERIGELLAAWRATRVRIVAVSDEVGSGLVPPTKAGRRFRDQLGRLNAAVAAESEEALLVVAGIALPLRGGADRGGAAAVVPAAAAAPPAPRSRAHPVAPERQDAG